MLYTADNIGLDKPCKLCEIDKDTIDHILQCIVLKLQVPDILTYCGTGISDAFGDDIYGMSNLVNLFKKAWRKREILLNLRLMSLL